MPTNFPYQGQRVARSSPGLQKIDIFGAGLMLTGIILLISGFEEASNFSPWVSGRVLGPVLASIPVILLFIYYEKRITARADQLPEPVFPWRFCSNRVIMGILM